MVQVVGKDQTVYKRVTCKKCGSVLEYAPIEIMKSQSRDITGCTEVREYINCPTCLSDVVLGIY